MKTITWIPNSNKELDEIFNGLREKQFRDQSHRLYKNYSQEITAGTIMAGMFLAEFAPKKTPWLHLDIAGVAYREKATGEPMLTLYYFLCGL